MSNSETSIRSRPISSVDEEADEDDIAYDNMKLSAVSGYSSETNTTKSTVKTAKFFNNSFYQDIDEQNFMIESTTQTQQNHPKDRLITDIIIIRHPRSILILAAIELCLSIKIIVFGLICRFYDGCPYVSSIWMGTVFLCVSIFGVIFVKLHPKRHFLIAYCTMSATCLCLTIALFAITAWLLDQEEHLIRQKGWDFLRQRIFELNRIVENTKIAMYALHLILTPAYGVCCLGTTVILCLNISAPASEELRGYYISSSPFGHQMVLVPVAVKTGAEEDITLYHTLQKAQRQPLKILVSTGTQTNIPLKKSANNLLYS